MIKRLEYTYNHKKSNALPAYILALIYFAVMLARPLILVKERLKRMENGGTVFEYSIKIE